jgi:hypothetical protein
MFILVLKVGYWDSITRTMSREIMDSRKIYRMKILKYYLRNILSLELRCLSIFQWCRFLH